VIHFPSDQRSTTHHSLYLIKSRAVLRSSSSDDRVWGRIGPDQVEPIPDVRIMLIRVPKRNIETYEALG
jgi:hypothetical protein